MSLPAGRRRLLFALAAIGWARAVAQHTEARPPADGAGGHDDPGLQRLEATLATQLARGRDALPLPWRETILKPNTARLVWRAHSLSAPKEGDIFRVAIDPPTRWYYIGRIPRAGMLLTLYGPLEEGAKGTFRRRAVVCRFAGEAQELSLRLWHDGVCDVKGGHDGGTRNIEDG